jgi:hypothetical protein
VEEVELGEEVGEVKEVVSERWRRRRRRKREGGGGGAERQIRYLTLGCWYDSRYAV